MIVCKPKAGSLFSLGIFSIGGILVGSFSLHLIITEPEPPWFHYLASFTLLPLGLIILIRLFWSYKIVEFGKQKIFVNFPFRFKSFSISLKEINQWEEKKINTRTGNYREIEIKSNTKLLSLNVQEYSHYLDALNYLEKKAGKLKNR